MKVTEHLEQATEPLITFEIIPPLRGGGVSRLLELVEDLARYHPAFIDITSHSAVVTYSETPTGIRKRKVRKRPGTLGVCALIQNRFRIDAVPHILNEGFTREETEDFLIELSYLGVDNVLAIRGDKSDLPQPPDSGRSRNEYAVDLIGQIVNMNNGTLLDDSVEAAPVDFCIGAAGYPEKHFEAPNLDSDIKRLKQKVEAGACYIVTQMFFDNQHYFDFVERCRAEGITVPIIPGLKIISSKRQITNIPRTFHCDIPPALADEIDAAETDHVGEIGAAWAAQQALGLLEGGAPSLHFYVLASSKAVNRVIPKLGL